MHRVEIYNVTCVCLFIDISASWFWCACACTQNLNWVRAVRLYGCWGAPHVHVSGVHLLAFAVVHAFTLVWCSDSFSSKRCVIVKICSLLFLVTSTVFSEVYPFSQLHCAPVGVVGQERKVVMMSLSLISSSLFLSTRNGVNNTCERKTVWHSLWTRCALPVVGVYSSTVFSEVFYQLYYAPVGVVEQERKVVIMSLFLLSSSFFLLTRNGVNNACEKKRCVWTRCALPYLLLVLSPCSVGSERVSCDVCARVCVVPVWYKKHVCHVSLVCVCSVCPVCPVCMRVHVLFFSTRAFFLCEKTCTHTTCRVKKTNS